MNEAQGRQVVVGVCSLPSSVSKQVRDGGCPLNPTQEEVIVIEVDILYSQSGLLEVCEVVISIHYLGF